MAPNTIAHIKVDFASPVEANKEFCLESKEREQGAIVANTLVFGDCGLMRVANCTDRYLVYKKGCHIANATEVSTAEPVQGDTEDVIHREMTAHSTEKNIKTGGDPEARSHADTDSHSLAGTSAATPLDHSAQGIIAQDCEVRDLRANGVRLSSSTVSPGNDPEYLVTLSTELAKDN